MGFGLGGLISLLVVVSHIIIHLPLVVLSSESDKNSSSPNPSCQKPFTCGNHGIFSFPFENNNNNNNLSCGLIKLYCDKQVLQIQPLGQGRIFDVQGQSLQGDSARFTVVDLNLKSVIEKKSCESFEPLLYFGHSSSISFTISPNITLFKCFRNPTIDNKADEYYGKKSCLEYSVYYKYPNATTAAAQILNNCFEFHLPKKSSSTNHDEEEDKEDELFSMLSPTFTLEWHVSDQCYRCHSKGGICDHEQLSYKFRCKNSKHHSGKNKKVILISALSGVGGAILVCIVFIYWRRRKLGMRSYIISKNTSSEPSSSSSKAAYDAEFGGGDSVYYNVPVFTYKELEEATCNFHSSKELGDGGFGTVYYGKLKDGREVAVKRLYENNYKRVQQFMNEIKILTPLRHRNLVTLYGCTSHRSRELLLVYEYISNGTVADHLHKDGAEPGSGSGLLPWPIRLKIAIETATALAYLHHSDIIHRDVKTNNILLDSNFCVKVADFGLSRLFPTGFTHVSTAPQGTPGYVDPEYHQCYQLTDKSDVYSFGVVLIELISSMPAVDISRHRHEINLANLAINRIQKCAFNELIDPSIGFDSDESIKRMAIAVAELAFLCLQQEREMRPTMDEVLETLKEILGENNHSTELNSSSRVDGCDSIELSASSQPPPSPESDDVVLLKDKTAATAPSPDALIHQWARNKSGKFCTSG